MVDLDPKIWKNKTLGAVGAGPFLQEVERQAREDRAARLAGREPRLFQLVANFPHMPVSGSVPSFFQDEFKLVNRDPYDLKVSSDDDTDEPTEEEVKPKKKAAAKKETSSGGFNK